MPAESLGPLLAAFEPRFGALTLLPLSPRPETPASRILLRGIKGSRAPLTLLPGRTSAWSPRATHLRLKSRRSCAGDGAASLVEIAAGGLT